MKRNISVQAETRDRGAAWTGRTVDALGIDTVAANCNSAAGLQPRGDAAADRSGIDLR